MIIKQIDFKFFKKFKKKTIRFSKRSFIKGKNGSGKTTLALESILFCYWGYTTKESLKDLPTRSISKSCSVGIQSIYNNQEYEIIRSYPTKLEIIKNGKRLSFSTPTQAQNYINDLFGDRVNFQKFRIVDANTKETNFLDEGQTAIKRILFSSSDKIFNDIKTKLNNIKYEREIYNKDKAVIYKYYPSQKRLDILKSNLNELSRQLTDNNNIVRDFQEAKYNIERNMGKLEQSKKQNQINKSELEINKACFACNQSISDSLQKNLLSDINKNIKEINESTNIKLSELKNVKDVVDCHRTIRDNITKRINKINDLKLKLESRLKQKDYKYTDKDVLIVKKALSEVDRLSTYYLTESLKTLEPIINNVLEKINFTVKFEINDKGKFAIKLKKEGIQYKYKDLSGGEMLILQIAFKLALLMERGEGGIIVADEGMSSLDEDNLPHVLNIFENFPFQLIFIIHNLQNVPQNIQTIDLNKEKNEKPSETIKKSN